MKTFKTILASCLAFALISAASAQTVIHFTGSTAYRAAVYTAIDHILKPGYIFGFVGQPNEVLRASEAIFTGTTRKGNYSVIIKTSFHGSIGGIDTLAANLTIGPSGSFTGGGGWLVDPTPQSGVVGTFPNGGTSGALANYDPALTADVALSDCFQASAPPLYQHPLLHDAIVGVVPFVYVATPGSPLQDSKKHPLKNVTSEQVKDLLQYNGPGLTLSALTGNALDTEPVLGVGADEDSGARVQALVCAGMNKVIFLHQYQPLYNGNTVPTNPPPAPPGSFPQITGAALWPTVTLNAISYPVGDSGYSNGGDLAVAVNVTHSGTGFPTFASWFISYLGINDAAYIQTYRGIILQFNGVPYTAANVDGPGAPGFTAQYTYWGYEHVFYRTTYSYTGKTVADQIAIDLTNKSASVSGILLGDMKVSRDTDGGEIELGGTPGK